MPYLTPTIGLWIPPADYVRFLSNLQKYLTVEIRQISYLECHVKDLLIKRKNEGRYSFDLNDMIIGRIDDVDIVFIHYKSFADAKSKWDRRRERVRYDNLIVKMNDQNECTEKDVMDFLALEYKNKLFITGNIAYKGLSDSFIFMDKYQSEGYVVDDTILKELPFDITNYLNTCFSSR